MNDNVIIGLYQDRDENAIVQTAKKYGSYCKKIALNILGNDEDAEECVNTAYLKVWERIPPEKPNVFYAFLAKITRNTAIDTYRRNNRQKRGTALIFEELKECISDKETPERTAENREVLRAVNEFLGRLPKKNRKLFVSRYCCCESIGELAMRFGMTEDNVAVSLHRIRKQLREYLAKEGYEI